VELRKVTKVRKAGATAESGTNKAVPLHARGIILLILNSGTR
jgi:hypothetical protein